MNLISFRTFNGEKESILIVVNHSFNVSVDVFIKCRKLQFISLASYTVTGVSSSFSENESLQINSIIITIFHYPSTSVKKFEIPTKKKEEKKGKEYVDLRFNHLQSSQYLTDYRLKTLNTIKELKASSCVFISPK